MNGRASQLVLAALARAAADPAGPPLFASKSEAGLFPATAAGKLAAQKAQDDGHLGPDAHRQASSARDVPPGRLAHGGSSVYDSGDAHLH